ncbi:uncharacterized protein LOC132285859 [Cornus florida]|uniref:uncharacterized protein LOC132285859 n=1 Tax=Cornus florida TaxID=4283 RepID=UPI0028A0BF72|nr:uncharacterized protein LOC132285859 [Cornus florida]
MTRVPSDNPMARPSMASILKAYSLPLILFTVSMYYQLFVIPRSFPVSHYDVLGINRDNSIEEVTDAYEKLSSNWRSSVEVPSTDEFIKIRYAFELLKNPLWKRDYDIFGIDEQVHVIEKLKEQYAGASFSEIDLPLLEAASFDAVDPAFNVITSENLLSKFEHSKAFLVQVFSFGSNRCKLFSVIWKRIATLLDGIANTGMVELGDFHLATYLAEKRSTGQPFFRDGLPSLVAFPPGCKTLDCLVWYAGELSVDAVTDWVSTAILSLPRITYYFKESLVKGFLAKTSHHKVKVIFFSKTGERATPFVRQGAKNYWAYASFAFVLWREEESSIWWNMFGVESAPAIVILKDPGVKPVVYHGSVNNSMFTSMMEQNKHQELPQLRSVTSMELGCDARGYSRAGNKTLIWYCVILAGRLSPELNQMRETIRRVQGILSNDGESNTADENLSATPSAIALKEKRLTFTWMDGEAQKSRCLFYIHSESSFETCGPRRDPSDVPRLLIVRYRRNATEDGVKIERKTNTILDAFQEDTDPSSQLVATYNGSSEILQIIRWISQIIEDGDSRDLPFFRTRTPALVPEDADPIWSRGATSIISTSKGMKQKIGSITSRIHDNLGDPRLGPILLLGALMSFGSIWLWRSQSTHSSQSIQSTMDENRRNRRDRRKTMSTRGQPSSITDMEPKDARQISLSDSDAE